jgi:hypothetical protein
MRDTCRSPCGVCWRFGNMIITAVMAFSVNLLRKKPMNTALLYTPLSGWIYANSIEGDARVGTHRARGQRVCRRRRLSVQAGVHAPSSVSASSSCRCRTASMPEMMNPPCDITCANKPAGLEPAVDGGAQGVGPSFDTQMQYRPPLADRAWRRFHPGSPAYPPDSSKQRRTHVGSWFQKRRSSPATSTVIQPSSATSTKVPYRYFAGSSSRANCAWMRCVLCPGVYRPHLSRSTLTGKT